MTFWFFLYIIFALALGASLASWASASCALAVFFLATLFILVSLLFFLLGAEFLGVLLLVIYAGAIILLFLFVIFLLNLRTVELYNDFRIYLPVGGFIGVLLWATVCLAAQESLGSGESSWLHGEGPWQDFFFFAPNLSLFGHLLYEHFGFFTVLVAVLLLTVMCAVIIVTLAMDNKQEGPVAGSPRWALEDLAKNLSLTLWAKRTRGVVPKKKE